MFPLEIDVLDCLIIGVGGGITMIGCITVSVRLGRPRSDCSGNGDLKVGSLCEPFVCVCTLGTAGGELEDVVKREGSAGRLESEIGSVSGNAIGPPAGVGIEGKLAISGPCRL